MGPSGVLLEDPFPFGLSEILTVAHLGCTGLLAPVMLMSVSQKRAAFHKTRSG